MDDDKKVPNTAPIIMIKIGNNLNIQNQGMVGYNGKLYSHKNWVVKEYLLKWKKKFNKGMQNRLWNHIPNGIPLCEKGREY